MSIRCRQMASRCPKMSCVAVCCSGLQCVAVCCSVKCQSNAVRWLVGAPRCHVLQCVAVCCSVLQCKMSIRCH